LVQRLLPERHAWERPALAVFVATPNVVDQKIEAAMAGANVPEQLLDFVVARVVASDGDSMTAARRKLLCGLVDGARNVVCRGATLTLRPVT
jgi:hypothetical protein